MNKYLTHLEIPDEVRKALLKEFYDNIHKAKIYTASNGIITRSLPDMEVIRLQDAEDCVIGHKIAKNLSLMVDEVIKPRYYRQAAGSDLEKHKDLNSTIALNVVLEGTGPVCFDDDNYIHYDCALLNVQEYHQVKTEDTRVLFRLTAKYISYEEVLECINGKEKQIFDI